MSSAQHSHRPTQKQTNKSFKAKKTSKGALKDLAKGRTHRPSVKAHAKTTNAMLSAAHNKLNRKNHAKQMQEKKKELLDDAARIFSRKGADRVSRIVAVVPLTSDVDAAEIAQQLLDSVNVECVGTGAVRTGDVVKFHNQSLRFVLLPSASDPSSLFPIIDACSAADFVIFGLSSEEEVDEQGETALRTLTGTGVGGQGGVFGVVKALPSNPALSSSTRGSLQSYLSHFFPSIDRVHCMDSTSEASIVVRSLCEKVPKGMRWRESRPRVLAEAVAWEATEGDLGTLRVEGVVRGGRLGANRLVHLQGYGDFMVERVTSAPVAGRAPKSKDLMDVTPSAVDLSVPDEDADDLQSTNVPDDEDLLLGEQTWPTEEEMASAPAASSSRHAEMLPPALPGTTPKRVKKIPKGMSNYQAAWIVDEEDEEDDYEGEEEDGDDEEMVEEEEEEEAASVVMDSAVDDTISERPFADLSPEQEQEQLQKYLADRARERAHQNRDDLDFPDEIDTPLHIPARERFARYRGMKSFRTSPWDPYEELPIEYSRCFMFEDFKVMGRKMERKAQNEGVEPGTRVALYIKNVPSSVIASYNPNLPFVVFGLLKHEHKYSVMHFTIQRNTECHETVRSKDPLVLCLGPRRFLINPVFSQHTARNGGKGSNNVHKFDRFLRHGINASIATAYLPITFGNQPAVLLRVPSSTEDPTIHLIGSGSLFSSDPTRITAKRLILTGAALKVHKKTATIRYMFFNQPDVEYYKPIQLRTKRGRTGHIRESLGTHGYFKAGFDGPIDQMDAICLNLYKRCYPKWGKVWDGSLVGAPKVREILEAAEEREGEDDVEMV